MNRITNQVPAVALESLGLRRRLSIEFATWDACPATIGRPGKRPFLFYSGIGGLQQYNVFERSCAQLFDGMCADLVFATRPTEVLQPEANFVTKVAQPHNLIIIHGNGD